MQTAVEITFLISTYNRRDILLQTLAELRLIGNCSGVTTEIIVVDNASDDGSADAVTQHFPAVRLIRSRVNQGACAKNAGLSIASGRYVVFLDDDSYPTADSLRRMIAHFTADPSLGAAVFDVTLPDGSHECSAYPHVFIGCGTGFRRSALNDVGGLPNDFFMQAEEYDLSLRLLNAGWSVQRFNNLHVLHLKTANARVPTRTTRLDVRNNLTLIARHFPRQWMLPFASDWMRRYRWIARSKGPKHELAFWRGLAEGIWRTAAWWRRSPVSSSAFEQFSQLEKIRNEMARIAADGQIRSILLLDVGKNIFAYWRAARLAGLRIVAIADSRLAVPGRRYQGVPVLSDDRARLLAYDAAVVANTSPIHAALRVTEWQRHDIRPVIDLLAQSLQSGISAA